MNYFEIKKISLIFLITISANFAVEGQVFEQSNAIRFKKYDGNNGIPGETIKTIYQDQSELMWLGVEYKGLVSFDGKSFKQYEFNQENENSISSNIINSICEDREGNLWIGTIDGLNKRKKTLNNHSQSDFLRFYNEENPTSIPSNYICQIFKNKNADLLIGTGQGLCLLESNNRFRRIPLTNSKDPAVRCIYQLKSGQYFVGTDKGLFKLSETYKKIGYWPVNEAQGRVTSMDEDVDGNLWIGTRSGLFIFSEEQLYEINEFLNENYHFSGMGIHNVFLDNWGRMWVGSYSRGLYIFYKNGKSYEFISNKALYENGFRAYQIRGITQDSQGLIWVATKDEGFYIYDHRLETFGLLNTTSSPLKLSSSSILAVFESSDKKLYIGTRQGGINIIDAQRKHITHFTHEPSNISGIGDNRVEGFAEQKSGEIWMATVKGLSKFFPESKVFKNYNFKPTHSIILDKNNQLWLGTTKGLFVFDPQKESFGNPPIHVPALEDNIRSLFIDNDQNLWIGTQNSGLLQYIPKNGIVKHYHTDHSDKKFRLPSNAIRAIQQDTQGNIWIGTLLNGLIKLEKNYNEQSYSFSKHVFDGTGVFSIIEGKSGVLWLSTNKGIYEFDSQLETKIDFGIQYGLQGEVFNNTAFLKSKNGYIYFGGNKGLNFFKPESVSKILFTPTTSIKSITVSSPGKDEYFKESLEGYHFKYGSYISFDFFLNDYSNPQNNKFKYRLEGITKDWIDLVNNNNISFASLKPGDYKLDVIGANSDGVWSKNQQTISFKILDPWWLSKIAKALYGIFIVFAIYQIIRFTTFRDRKKHELEIIKLEKSQAEKIIEEKLRFFTDISHELRTPLTIILPSAEKLVKIKKGNIEEVKKHGVSILRNVKALMNLVEDLLEFRKIENGSIVLNTKSLQVIDYCHNTFSEFSFLAESKKIDYHFNTNLSEFNAMVDPNILNKVLSNLLSNAIKYTQNHGHIELVITSTTTRDKLLILVKDTGIGISKEDLPNIFDRFYRAKSEVTSRGTGIGLALTKSLVELHGGTIYVHSEEGKGSIFTVEIPLNYVEELQVLPISHANISHQEVEDETAQITFEQSEDPISIQNENVQEILVVEDDLEIQNLLKELFSDYKVIIANNGKEGLEFANQKSQPSLIISDVMMPVMDGLTFCREIKGNFQTSHIPVLMLTAKTTTSDQMKGINVGADDYVLKPFYSDILVAKVENLLKRQIRLRKYFEKSISIQPSDPPTYNREKELLIKCKEIIEVNISNQEFSVEKLAEELGLSRVHLFRKLKYLINQSPLELIYSIRLKKSIALIKTGNYTVSEVAYMTGFSSPSSFNTTFKKHYKESPKAYVKKLTKETS
ncbi:two-component regulator propeller domain-containing protein [Mariniflexile sp. HNIBRBA6329]|uniref:hybrid sensor histidine kinase/response regulator n=1 Tax=Mariniflexile sp. HNIBRBA6329 TaxID=3373088 RepID=UPI0037455E8F